MYAAFLKFIYSEKATKFCEISNVDLTGIYYIGQIYGGDFAKFCGLLRNINSFIHAAFLMTIFAPYKRSLLFYGIFS